MNAARAVVFRAVVFRTVRVRAVVFRPPKRRHSIPAYGRFAVAVTLAVVLATPSARAGQAQRDHPELADAALLSRGVRPSDLGADVIVSWNSLAHDIAFAEDQFLTFKGQRALAMMHLAMHDALNAIVPIYRSLRLPRGPSSAHIRSPPRHRRRTTSCSRSIPISGRRLAISSPAGLHTFLTARCGIRGVALGRATAAAMLAQRGATAGTSPGTYTFGDDVGHYQTTPPWNGFVAQPGFRFAKPFVLDTPDQFRPSPPPALRTKAYARAFREVKERRGRQRPSDRGADRLRHLVDGIRRRIGESAGAAARDGAAACICGERRECSRTSASCSTTRTSQPGTRNTRTTIGVRTRRSDPPTARRQPAIRCPMRVGSRSARRRRFPSTRRPTRPPVPPRSECSLERFGDRVPFTMETTTAPPGMPARSFDSFSAAAAECADSRVRLGWHFRYATEAGLVLGRRIARYVSRHALRARHGEAGPR